MSIEEKRREKFEAYIRKSYSEHCAEEGEGLFQREDSGYSWYWVDELWRAYVDALDSVEVELPEEDPRGFGPGDCGDGRPSFEQQLAADCNCVLRECRAAIEACGLKVKV